MCMEMTLTDGGNYNIGWHWEDFARSPARFGGGENWGKVPQTCILTRGHSFLEHACYRPQNLVPGRPYIPKYTKFKGAQTRGRFPGNDFTKGVQNVRIVNIPRAASLH